MSQTPSLCGGFLTDKRSMVAFVWSVTTVLTIFAFATAIVLTVKVHTHYKYLQRFYDGDDWYQASDSYYNYDNSQDENENNESQDEKYRDQIRDSYMLLSSMSAKSVTFVAVYTMILATALSMYGSLAIVGFTSLRGVYIAPCLSIGSTKLRVGMFGGMIVIFANLMLVCAVVLGEVKVCVCCMCVCLCAQRCTIVLPCAFVLVPPGNLFRSAVSVVDHISQSSLLSSSSCQLHNAILRCNLLLLGYSLFLFWNN